MGRYFGREPRYSQEEIKAQATQAIEAQVGRGRPPEDEWRPLEARLEEIDRQTATRPVAVPVPEQPPTPAPVGATTPPA